MSNKVDDQSVSSLGAFSVSLAVKDLAASRDFYTKLGFQVMGDYSEQGWMMLKNGPHIIGLFQGMFERNMLTFNPGWDQNAKEVNPFTDVLEIRAKVEAAGLEVSQVTGGEEGPGSFVVVDPDGNPVLVDQHR
ncbi:MAG: VOC family protein [Pseudomonadota bacterium]